MTELDQLSQEEEKMDEKAKLVLESLRVLVFSFLALIFSILQKLFSRSRGENSGISSLFFILTIVALGILAIYLFVWIALLIMRIIRGFSRKKAIEEGSREVFTREMNARRFYENQIGR